MHLLPHMPAQSHHMDYYIVLDGSGVHYAFICVGQLANPPRLVSYDNPS